MSRYGTLYVPGVELKTHVRTRSPTNAQTDTSTCRNNPSVFILLIYGSQEGVCFPIAPREGERKVSDSPVLRTPSPPSIWPLFWFYYTRITISRSATPVYRIRRIFFAGLCWCSKFPFSACIFNWVLSQWCGNDLFFALCSLDSSSESVTLIKTFTLISQRTPFFVH